MARERRYFCDLCCLPASACACPAPASPPERGERDLAGAPHAEPSDCPTYYDGCHCTVEALTHNIARAEAAERERDETKEKAAKAARYVLDVDASNRAILGRAEHADRVVWETMLERDRARTEAAGNLARADSAESALSALREAVRGLLATWERNRADPRYGDGAPGPLYVAGMAAEADGMIAGLRALVAGAEKGEGR